MTATAVSKTEQQRPAFIFLRHLGEMTLAMFIGMFAFALALGVIAGVAGSSLESVRVSQPSCSCLEWGRR